VVAIKELRSNSSNRQNVVEENSTKGDSPTAVFWNPNRPNRAVSSYRLLNEVPPYSIFHFLNFHRFFFFLILSE
jgi:hypothetical protein